MNWKKTIILGLIFLCAMAGYFADRSRSKQRQLIKERENALIPFVAEKVARFMLVNASGTYRLQKEGETWFIIEPRRLPADADQAQSLLANLSAAKQYDPVETSDFAQYGLDKPRASIALEDPQTGAKATLRVGLESTARDRFFASFEGEKKVFTIAVHIKNALEKNLYHLREKKVFGLKKDRIASVLVQYEGVLTYLQKIPDGKWLLQSPFMEETDAPSVENFLSTLETLRAASFLDDAPTTPGSFGFDSPRAVITVQADDTTTLIVGSAESINERCFARIKDAKTVFTITETFMNQLAAAPNSLRSREVIKLKESDLSEIKLIAGDSYISLVRDEKGEWQLKGDESIRLDRSRLRRLFADLASLRISSFETDHPLSLQPYGLDNPRARVILYPQNREERVILSFGNQAEGRDIAYASISDRPLIFGVDWTRVGDFYLVKSDLEDRRFFDFESGAIHRISIKDKDFDGALEKKGERWFAVLSASTKSPEVANPKLTVLLTDLLNLEYEMEVQESRVPSGASIIEIKISDKDAKQLAGLSVFMEDAPQIAVKTAVGKTYLARRPNLENFIESFKNIFQKEK